MVVDRFRKPGQGGDADNQPRDLRAELLAAEAANQAKKNGRQTDDKANAGATSKRPLQLEEGQESPEDEDPEAKRRRILEETRDIDADSDGADSDSSEEESDEEDETAELMRELEKIKRERAEQKAKEVSWKFHPTRSWLNNIQGSCEGCQRGGGARRGYSVGKPAIEPQSIQREEALGRRCDIQESGAWYGAKRKE